MPAAETYTLLVPHDTPLAKLERERKLILSACCASGQVVYPVYPLGCILGDEPPAYWKKHIEGCALEPPAAENGAIYRPLSLSLSPGVSIGSGGSFCGFAAGKGMLYGLSPDKTSLYIPSSVSAGCIPVCLRIFRLYSLSVLWSGCQPFSAGWELSDPIWVKLPSR